MAKKKIDQQETTDYRHSGEKRTNIPPAKIASEGSVPRVAKARYAYSPHLPPVLRFDESGKADKVVDRVEELLAKSTKYPLTEAEASEVREALSNYQPWLEWAGKREQHERGSFEVDPVALHIHERVSARACIRAALREDVQKDLFADPQQPYREAVQFYRHDVDWANRLILGDSLQVMSSLARRENLSGKVQMIYMDPPYGIKFASNFQPLVGKRDVKDKDSDLVREAEVVRAYRDTWQVGVHSYLEYLGQRLASARDLLTPSGSLFVQISEENLHRVRSLLDEVFGVENFVALVSFQTTSGFAESSGLSRTGDYILWYAREREQLKSSVIYERQDTSPGSQSASWLLQPDRTYRGVSAAEATGARALPPGSILYMPGDLQSQGSSKEPQPFSFEGKSYWPGANSHWKPNYPAGLERLAASQRIHVAANSIRYRRLASDFPLKARGNLWTDTLTGSFTEAKLFAVQTNPRVIERCLLLATSPGDLVLDPTCGSGTTAFVAEQWGRRWITVDTSRVALSITRQRLLTGRFEHFRTRGGPLKGNEQAEDPVSGFVYKEVPHITLKSIAQNSSIDAIVARYEPDLEAALEACNAAVRSVPSESRQQLKVKLEHKQSAEGKKAVTEADRLRWDLPSGGFEHWTVPFDVDSAWPAALEGAVNKYRALWLERLGEISAAIEANAEPKELVDQPEVVKGVVRVSGPFTVEGVRPEELSLGDEGLFDGTPNDFEDGETNLDLRLSNLSAFLTEMAKSLRGDGLTFLNNKRRQFERLESLFEGATGSVLHAEGVWEGEDANGPATVAVTFGPQYGPVTAQQVEEAIRAAKRYDELVVAGFSFDAEASAVIEESKHPKLRIHAAFIRPDINPGMEGLLKETPNSQLFTVFGQPDVEVKQKKDGEWVVKLEGVEIYDPVANTVRSTGADKVAAWFLDQDYDGRCFCITQAFFPDQDAWEKLAKALKGSADSEAFEAFKGTKSLPFAAGKHKRIAVKVIDPRGNEVMAIRKLES